MKHWPVLLGAISVALMLGLFLSSRGANTAELQILQNGVACVAHQQNEHRLNSYEDERRLIEAHGRPFEPPGPGPAAGVSAALAGACERFLADMAVRR